MELRGANCSAPKTIGVRNNKLINGGCAKFKGSPDICGFSDFSQLVGRCRTVEADAAFLFLGFIASLVAAVLYLSVMRNQKKGLHAAV